MGAVTSRTLSVCGPQDLTDVVFRIVDQSRYTEVLDLLYTNFHTDEPMSRALKIFDGTNRIPEADEYTLRALAENLSLMAVDSVTNKGGFHLILHFGQNMRRERGGRFGLGDQTCGLVQTLDEGI